MKRDDDDEDDVDVGCSAYTLLFALSVNQTIVDSLP